MAAGDIACDPTAAPDAAQGNGTRTCAQNRVARQIAAADPDAVLPLGDNQYERGSLAAYRASYDATWGELKGISYPAPGNHEWLTRDAEGYREYFASGTPKEVDEVRGYYSFDLEGWHFVSLDSDCSKVGGCQKDSPMYTWLAEDLAVHAGRPTVVYWHHPRWSSGEHGSMDMTEPLWELLLADRDVQILLSGHDHDYERFAPMGPTGPEPGGIRQFVAGTGGNNHTCAGPAGPIAGSEAFDCTVFGALQLTLHPDGSYDWFFTGAQGTGTYTDHGTQAHR
jgi:hypothetical protein